MLPEVFIEERQIVEAQGECNLFYRKVGRFQLRFCIHDNNVGEYL